ncbi:hypothetical protein BH09BAC2_BH09BAC2_12600 [soil metagenome]
MGVSKKLIASVGTVFSLNQIGGRKNIEDSISPPDHADNPGVFLVCDGVGGNSNGEVASDLAVKAFYKIFTEEYDSIRGKREFDSLLDKAILSFKSKVQEYVAEHPASKNTSTTLTIAVLKENKIYIGWCGDSRIYHIRKGQILYRTTDHSLVEELIAGKVITAEEALSHPQKNIITRSLDINIKEGGVESAVLEDLREGDWILLCTDGLMEQFKESTYSDILNSYDEDTNYAKKINDICEGKTGDNFSMYLINYKGEKTNTISSAASPKKTSMLLPIFFFLLAAGLAYYFLIYKKTNQGATNTTTPAKDTSHNAGTLLVAPPAATNTNVHKADSHMITTPVKISTPVKKPVVKPSSVSSTVVPGKINVTQNATPEANGESKIKPPKPVPVAQPDQKLPDPKKTDPSKKEVPDIK